MADIRTYCASFLEFAFSPVANIALANIVPLEDDTAGPFLFAAPSAVKSAPSAVESAPSAVESAPSAVKSAPSAVENAPSAVENAPSAVENAPSAVESAGVAADHTSGTRRSNRNRARKPIKPITIALPDGKNSSTLNLA